MRLIALDVDGTLLTSDHRITEPTRVAIERVRTRGVVVLLATSRGPRALRPVLEELEPLHTALFVASQGAVTARFGQDLRLRITEQHPAPVLAAHRLVEDALAAGLSVHWFTGPRWYVSHIDETVESEARAIGAEPETRDLLAERAGPDKIMLISRAEDTGILDGLRERLPWGLMAHVSHPGFLEITRSGVDKGFAVSRYCRDRGIDASSVVAIGDGLNDLGLFAFAGTSVAPASARPEVLEAASLITSSNDEDGVALALNRLVP